MAPSLRRAITRIAYKVRNQFIVGLVVLVPTVITLWVLGWIFSTFDNILQPIVRFIFGRNIIGVGFITTIVIVYLVGLISANVVGRRLILFGEEILSHVPFVRPLFKSVKEVVSRFSEPSKNNILQVVLIDYPRKGTKSLAFVTSEYRDKSNKRLLTLLVPTAPNPMSGFVVVLPEDEVMKTSIRPEVAMRMLVSCGALVPKEISEILANATGLIPPKEG